MSKFTDDMKKFTDASKRRAEEIAANFANELLATVTDRTPIDTGNAKDSWHIEGDNSKYKIWNSAPYFYVLEYGLFPNPPIKGAGKTSNGFSTQAPQGIIGITIVEAPQILQEVVRKK